MFIAKALRGLKSDQPSFPTLGLPNEIDPSEQNKDVSGLESVSMSSGLMLCQRRIKRENTECIKPASFNCVQMLVLNLMCSAAPHGCLPPPVVAQHRQAPDSRIRGTVHQAICFSCVGFVMTSLVQRSKPTIPSN